MKGSLVLLIAVAAVCAADYPTECPADQATNWEIELLLPHEDCHRFYKCTLGKPVEYRCYGELYFNLETWECDWPQNVDCTGRIDPAYTTLAPTTPEVTTTTAAPTTTTPEPTTTTTTPEPTTTTTTPEPTTTTTTPEPTTTTTTTTTTTPAPTTTTTTTTTTTPAPTTTTPEPTTTTTTPEPTTTTTTTTTTTPAPTTTTTTTTTTPAPECEVDVYPEPTPESDSDEDDSGEDDDDDDGDDGDDDGDDDGEDDGDDNEMEFLPNGCPVDPHIHWLLPHEYDCNLFYYCVWGEKVLRQCGSAVLHFNPKKMVCDWPQDAGCTVSVNKHADARRQLLNQLFN